MDLSPFARGGSSEKGRSKDQLCLAGRIEAGDLSLQKRLADGAQQGVLLLGANALVELEFWVTVGCCGIVFF